MRLLGGISVISEILGGRLVNCRKKIDIGLGEIISNLLKKI